MSHYQVRDPTSSVIATVYGSKKNVEHENYYLTAKNVPLIIKECYLIFQY